MSAKTEKPTRKKIREARERGEVAKSTDLTQAVLTVATLGYILVQASAMVDAFTQMMLVPFDMLTMNFQQAASTLAQALLTKAVVILGPFLLIVIGLGILIEAAQTGMLISFKALMPTAKKLNVMANAKHMVSKKNLAAFIKSMLKIVFLSALVYALVRDSLQLLVNLSHTGFVGMGMVVGSLLDTIFLHIAVAYTIVALADLLWQRKQYTKELMMSKDEVKQENKQMEGDRHIKEERRQFRKELLENVSVESARSASAVVTNPTHLAIALRYVEGKNQLPIVQGKGEGLIAQLMIDAARKAGVPVMQNIPLAHALFEEAAVNQYIPSDLIEPVAEVLRLVREIAAGNCSNTLDGPY